MKDIVVDASVAAKWFLEEVHSEAARKVLDENYMLHIPDFFFIEMDNILWKRTSRKDIKLEDAQDIRKAIRKFPLNVHVSTPILDAAFELAIKCGLSVYDCLYVSLAVLLNARVVTADRKLHDVINKSPLQKHVLWVVDIGK